jgi:hypothetical protein
MQANMTIAKNIIKTINNMDDIDTTEYVDVFDNFSENDFNIVINELNSMTNKISLKNIETFKFVILTKFYDTNFQYNIELINGLDDDNYFRIDRSIRIND